MVGIYTDPRVSVALRLRVQNETLDEFLLRKLAPSVDDASRVPNMPKSDIVGKLPGAVRKGLIYYPYPDPPPSPPPRPRPGPVGPGGGGGGGSGGPTPPPTPRAHGAEAVVDTELAL